MCFHSEIRFLRSTCMNMELMTICFIVIAVDFSNEYENLAFEKSTWQSTTYDPTVGSEKAVDGLKSVFSYSGKQCSISRDDEKTATWWIDLGRILSINNIVIYYRTDGNTWNASNYYTGRFLGFFIYVSNTTDRHAGHVCFHDTYYTRSTIPPMVNLSCLFHGRYVIYYNERLPNVNYPSDYSIDAYIELCEVEVYGCSMPRHYGPDCSLPCPVNCEDYCHIQTGICFECKAGKKGYSCEQDCDGRTYGLGCRLLCGNCFNSKQCHHVNGSCFDGCDTGYKGPLCKTECVPGEHGVNCNERCSKHCSMTNKCNPETGHCDSGCKSGWKGPLCDEGPTEDATDWQSRFYGVLAALCVCIAMFMMFLVAMFLRRRGSSGIDRENNAKDNKDEPCNINVTVKAEEIINSKYQGLEDQTDSSAYDFIR